MKKRIILAIVLVMLSAALFSGCSAINAKNEAEEMLYEYFGYFNDEDMDECIDMYGDELMDDLGDEDSAEFTLMSLRYFLGEVEHFNVTSFDADGNSKEAQVVFSVDVEYENEDRTEEYIFYKSGDKMEIIGFDLGDHPKVDELIEGYFEDYTDMDHIKDFYIPYTQDNFFSLETEQAWADSVEKCAGDFVDYKINTFNYMFDRTYDVDDIYYLADVTADLEFENEDFVFYGEISREEDDIKFNYVEYFPKAAYNIVIKYLEDAKSGDSDSIINMYNEKFFTYSEITEDEWQTQILDYIYDYYGKLVYYNIYYWEYSVLELDGVEYELYTFSFTATYETAELEESLTIIKGENSSAVIGHALTLLE